jgi:hypothetical protein
MQHMARKMTTARTWCQAGMVAWLCFGSWLVVIPAGQGSPAWSIPTLHAFDDDIIGANPAGETLSVVEPAGSGHVEVVIKDGHKCVQVTKTGGTERVRLIDTMSTLNGTRGAVRCLVRHDASAFGLNLVSTDGIMIVDMVWWNGAITNGPRGAFLATYQIDQWIDVVMYFDIEAGWTFTLDGKAHGTNYSIPLTTHLVAPGLRMVWSSFFSGGGDGKMFVDDISYDLAGTEPTPAHDDPDTMVNDSDPGTAGIDGDPGTSGTDINPGTTGNDGLAWMVGIVILAAITCVLMGLERFRRKQLDRPVEIVYRAPEKSKNRETRPVAAS